MPERRLNATARYDVKVIQMKRISNMQTNNHPARATQYWLTAIAVLAVVVIVGILAEVRQPQRQSADTRQHGFCMPMIEDFCPGQPTALTAKKQRTFVLM
jgi:hypothetical protein